MGIVRFALKYPNTFYVVARLRKIAITTDYGTEIEVHEGIKDGDKVILQPPVNLADGNKVQIIPDPPQATP